VLFEVNGEYITYRKNPNIRIKFRRDPIPGTGNFHRGHCLREIHTTPEMRRFVADEEMSRELDIHKPMRQRRSRNNLPNSWVDIVRSDANGKSWKRNRKTQYRERRNLS